MAQSAVVPSVQEPVSSHHGSSGQPLSPTSSSDSHSVLGEDESAHDSKYHNQHLARPKLGSRKSSGTMIVPREKAIEVILDQEEYDEDDVRTMSPRRNSSEVDQLGEDARRDLREQAKTLQMSLQDIVNKMELVKTEQEKLEAGNKFLQSYIGELMQTSRITSNPTKSKGKGRGAR